MGKFRASFPFNKRCEEAQRILKKYPNRVPIIVERLSKSSIPKLDKKKYLVPHDLTVGQFSYIIRKRIHLEPTKALFLFMGDNILPATSELIGEAYEKYANEDKFLYCIITGENTFG